MDLPLEAFSKRADAADGRKGQCRPCVQAVVKERVPRERSRASGEKVPIGPFRDWLMSRIQKYGSACDVARELGLSEREVYRFLKQSKMVTVATVDHALTRDGGTMLWEIYPELYP